MNKLKESLQNDLNFISSKIDEGYNNDDIIIQNIDFLLCVASDQHFRLKKSPTIKDYLNNYVDDEECASKEYIDSYYNYKDFNIALTKIGQKLNNEYDFEIVDERYKSKIVFDDSIKIVADFFKDYDKDIYDYYENFIMNGKLFIVNEIFDGYGLSSVSDELLEPYLFLQNNNNIIDLMVIAHEIIHIYLSEKEKYISNEEFKMKYINGINEVYSHYIEYIFLDYLESINYNKIDIINHKKNLYSDLIERLAVFYVMLESNIDFKSYDEVSFYNELKLYSYGLYFLYHFYDQYLEDKDKAKENITNFMLDSKKYDFKHLINNYGLKEENLRDYKVLLKHIEKIY